MKKEIGILWFRHDMRLHDNEALEKIRIATESFLPVYILDPRQIGGEAHSGLPGMSHTRIRFLLDSLHDLRSRLKEKGSDLIIRTGKPEKILYHLTKEYQLGGVYCNRERMPHETAVQNKLERKLWTLGQEIHYYRGKMLFYTSDLPFPVPRTPENFASFLKETEHFIPIRQPIPVANQDFQFPRIDIDRGEIPKMSDFGYSDDYVNPCFQGGENAGLDQLGLSIKRMEETGDSHLGVSPWISIGNLSPKDVYHKLDRADRLDSNVLRTLKRNLILRDFYRLTGKKEPVSLFAEGGFRQMAEAGGHWDWSLLKDWIAGRTGHDYVDACMKCLSATGYLTHKQRKAVAYFLVDKMEVHWLLGAGYFESVLLDYDPCSNYVNWQRIAGLSPDLKGRQGLNFDLIAGQEDADGSFRHQWRNVEVPVQSFNFVPIGALKLEN